MLTPEQVKKGFEALCDALGPDYVLDMESTGVPRITRKVGKDEVHIQRETLGNWGDNQAVRIRHSASYTFRKNIPEYIHGQKDIDKVDFAVIKAKAEEIANRLQVEEQSLIQIENLAKVLTKNIRKDFKEFGIGSISDYSFPPAFDLTALLHLKAVEAGYIISVHIPASRIFTAEEVKKFLAFLQDFIGEQK